MVHQISTADNQTSRNRVYSDIVSNFVFRPKTADQRQNSGPSALISPVEPSQAQDFRRARGAARCKFLEKQRKQRELARNPLVSLIAPAFEAPPAVDPPVSPELWRLSIIPS
jgi:hypothetical protein